MSKAFAVARSSLRRFFSISAFTPPPPAAVPPPAEPSSNLFVSGLSKRTTTEGLREAFLKFGNVVDAKVVTDRVSGYSKGFGFVRYASVEEAAEGIKGMDGKFLDGWVIFAEYARPRPPPSQAPTSLPQSSYSGPLQSNYSSPMSHSPSYYAPPSNYSPSSQTTQPPLNNSFTSTPLQYSSNPQSNYSPSPQTTQPSLNDSFTSSQTSPLEYTPSQNPHSTSRFNPPQANSYFNHPTHSSQPPSSYLSETSRTQFSSQNYPSWSYESAPASAQQQTSGYPPMSPSNYSPPSPQTSPMSPSNYTPPQPSQTSPMSPSNYTPPQETSQIPTNISFASSLPPNHSQAFEDSASYNSEYEPGKASNY